MIESLKTIIQAQPFFAGFSESTMDLIVGCASNVKFPKGAYLMHDAEAANEFFLIREGRVEISVHGAQYGTVKVQTLDAGEMVGWSWLVPPYRSRFDAMAVEDTRALRFDGKCLRDKCETDPSTGYELLKRVSTTLAQRLEGSRFQLMDVYGRNSH
jgi:CRP/FNR family cyclic AMP-dependent transcriptional regulator